MAVVNAVVSSSPYVFQAMASGPLSVAAALKMTKLKPGTTGIEISDTVANVQKNLDALQKVMNNLSKVTVSDPASVMTLTAAQWQKNAGAIGLIDNTDLKVAVTSVSAANAATVASQTHVDSIAITDTSANIASRLDSLQGIQEKIAGITQSSAAPLPLTHAQFLADTEVLGKIKGAYTLAIRGATVDQALALQSNTLVKSIAILDNSENISNSLDDLKNLGLRLKEVVTSTSATAIDLTADQIKSDALVIGKLYSGYQLAIHHASISQFASLTTNKKVVSIDVEDSAQNISKNLNSLQKLYSHIGNVTVKDSNPVKLSSSQLLLDSNVIDKMDSDAAFIVTEVSAAEASALADTLSNRTGSTFSITDTGANIGAYIDDLSTIDDSLLTSIVPKAPASAIPLSALQYADSGIQSVLGKVSGYYALTLSNVASDQLGDVVADSHVATLTISDSASNLSTNFDAIYQLGKKVSRIDQTDDGTPLSLTFDQFANKSVALGKIDGSYSVSVTKVPVNRISQLLATPQVVSMSVSDTGQQLVRSLSTLQNMSDQLVSVEQTDMDSNPMVMTVDQLDNSAALLTKFDPNNYTLDIRNVRAADAQRVSATNGVIQLSVVDSSANIASNLDDLATLQNDVVLTSITQSNPTGALAITAQQYADQSALLGLISGRYSVALSEVQAADVATLAADAHVASLDILDTGSEISSALENLFAAGKKIRRIALTDDAPIEMTATQYSSQSNLLAKLTGGYGLTVTDVAAANAAQVGADARVVSLSVKDKGEMLARNLDTLQGLGSQLTAIDQTDTEALTLSYQQLTADGDALALLANDLNYTLNVLDASALAAGDLQTDDHVVSFSVLDTSANLADHIDDLDADSKLVSILQMSDPTTLTLSATQLANDQDTLDKFRDRYTLNVTNVAASDALTVAQQNQVTSFTVVDSGSNIATALADLNKAGRKLTSIVQDDAPETQPLNLHLSLENYSGNLQALNKIQGGYSANLTGVSATQAASVAEDSHVESFSVSDTAARLSAFLDTLQSVGSKVFHISQTNAGPLSLTLTQLNADLGTLSKLDSFSLSLRNVAIADLTDLVSQDVYNSVDSISINDTVANLSAHLDDLANYDANSSNGPIDTITLSDASEAIALTATQRDNHASLLDKIQGNYSLSLRQVLAADATTLASDSHVVALAVQDSVAHVQDALADLSGLASLQAVSLTDPDTALALTPTTLNTYGSLLAKIQGNYSVAVTDVTLDKLSDLMENDHIVQFSISDTSAAVAANFEALRTLGSALPNGSITLTDDTEPLDISYEQWLGGTAVLDAIHGSYLVNLNGVPADSVASLAADAHVQQMVVSDSAENLAHQLDTLQDHQSKISHMTLTDTQPLQLTAAQSARDADVLAKLTGQFTLEIVG